MTKTGFAEVNGTRLYYELTGTGHPLVLIHGFTLDTRMWDDQFDVFGETYQVIRYDMRGFGKSALPTGEAYTHHDDLKALLDHLGIASAYVAGLSLGGAVAVDFALAYPQRVDALIPVDTSALSGYSWPEAVSAMLSGVWSTTQQEGIPAGKAAWLALEWFTPAREKPAVSKQLAKIVADYSAWHFVNENPIRALQPPATERLGTIRVPTLVVLGARDLIFYNHPIADLLEGRIFNARKVVIPGVGHMSNMENPQTFNGEVLRFLDEL